MISLIKEQIENINSAIAWIKKNRPNEFKQRYLQLVEERRKLNIIAKATRNNPGIAAFGQSQVGKSYLMNCILQDNNGAFMVDTPDGEKNFVDQINPIGEGQEATGVVTRFTSYKRNEAEYNPTFPIRFRSLSVRDIILIICDTYYNDFSDYTTEGELDIMNRIEQLESSYASKDELQNIVLTPDDMLDMKLYIKKHVNNAQVFTGRVAFFDRLVTLIDRIPVADYPSVFSILWNNETELTKLFQKCINILQRIHFAEYIYLPIGAVLHGGVKENTIMSVACLKLLLEDRASEFKTEAYISKGESMERLGSFTKSELCTICSEVVIRIREQYLTSTGKYDLRGIDERSVCKLPQGEVSMDLLTNADLLDFPGARARENGLIAKLSSHETLIYSFLRGKIAYLFNKYNEERTINILLHCHHQKNMDATQMWHLLNDWVAEYVGNTPSKRAKLLEKTGGSPLFHIGTFFNKDLEYPDNQTEGCKPESIKARWNSRFDSLLANDCFHRSNVDWVLNWNGNSRPFQNCYMLRDFKFSRQVYSGHAETSREEKMLIDKTYYNDMRAMFIESNNTVHHMFKDPELSWDTSATIGNDGSLYIIQQLSKVVGNIYDARESQLKDAFEEILNSCHAILSDYYVSDDTGELLKVNIKKAHGIFRELEFTCQNDPEYFGHLVESLQMTEAESFKRIHALIPELTATVHGNNVIKDYELIRKRCHDFAGCETVEEMWKCFMNTYLFSDREEAAEYLTKKGIDAKELFKGKSLQRKNSAVISNDMIQAWEAKISGPEFINEFCGESSVDEAVMSNLISCIISTSQNINLQNHIEKQIAEYADVLSTANINEDFIADIISTTISDFVVTLGYDYLSEEQKETSRRVAQEQHLQCFDWIERERKEIYDDDEMTELFNSILSSTGTYTPAYDANYNCWLEFMYIAFISNIKVPKYDIEANNLLKVILESFRHTSN